MQEYSATIAALSEQQGNFKYARTIATSRQQKQPAQWLCAGAIRAGHTTMLAVTFMHSNQAHPVKSISVIASLGHHRAVPAAGADI